MEPSAKGENAIGDGQTSAGGDARVDLRAEAPSVFSSAAFSSTDFLPQDQMAHDAIGKALQAHYHALTEAPLPDRFLVLLAQLEAKDSQDD